MQFYVSRLSSNRFLEYNQTFIPNDEFSSNWTPVTVTQFLYIRLLDHGWFSNKVHHQGTFLVCTIFCLPCCVAWQFRADYIGEEDHWRCRCPVSSCSESWSIDPRLKNFQLILPYRYQTLIDAINERRRSLSWNPCVQQVEEIKL